ncbi:MAG: insulinase family protein [Magnetococcales bacterium]|nr:insulinase family protein [Magnetococcales bacterium]
MISSNRRVQSCLWFLLAFVLIPWGEPLAGIGGDLRHFQTREGLTVILVENSANPMVELRLLVPAGATYDPEGKEGLASLTAWMFNEGGGDQDSKAFRERMDFYGISLGADAHRDSMEVSLTTLTEHLDEAWSMLADALMKPRFDSADFERARSERLASLIKDQERPRAIAGRAIMAQLYAGHPYARPVKGTPESVAAITLKDLEAYHDNAFRAPGMVLAVAGDVSESRLRGLVARYLSGLNSEPGVNGAIPLAERQRAGRQVHIEKDLPQTVIRMGLVGFNRNDPDYFPALVMNHILGGGGFGSRLTEEVREKRGLAYSVYSYFSPLMGRGPFMVGMQTKTASTGEAIALIRHELERMVAEGVTAEELLDAKRYLTGSFPLRLDGLGKLASNWSAIGFYRRGWDYLEQWPERIREVTQADVLRVAKRFLDLKRLFVVTVGRSSGAGVGKPE